MLHTYPCTRMEDMSASAGEANSKDLPQSPHRHSNDGTNFDERNEDTLISDNTPTDERLRLLDIDNWKEKLRGLTTLEQQDLMEELAEIIMTAGPHPDQLASLAASWGRFLHHETGYVPAFLQLSGIENISVMPIAGGGFSNIYSGTYCGEEIILKYPRSFQETQIRQMEKAIEREAMVMMFTSHPNLLAPIGTYRDEKRGLALVLPFMKNGNAKEYLRGEEYLRREAVSGAVAMRMVLETARALSHLHSCSVIHGDVKAENILVANDRNRSALLADAGLATFEGPRNASSMGMAVTYSHAAPELLSNEDALKTKESDIFAFGITMFEIIARQSPFSERMWPHMIAQKIQDGVRPLREQVPAGQVYDKLWTVMQAAWSHDPKTRPTMAMITDWLENILRP